MKVGCTAPTLAKSANARHFSWWMDVQGPSFAIALNIISAGGTWALLVSCTYRSSTGCSRNATESLRCIGRSVVACFRAEVQLRGRGSRRNPHPPHTLRPGRQLAAPSRQIMPSAFSLSQSRPDVGANRRDVPLCLSSRSFSNTCMTDKVYRTWPLGQVEA